MNREGTFDILLVTAAGHEVERALDDYYAIYADSWKKREGDPQFHRHLGRTMAEKGRSSRTAKYPRATCPSPRRYWWRMKGGRIS